MHTEPPCKNSADAPRALHPWETSRLDAPRVTACAEGHCPCNPHPGTARCPAVTPWRGSIPPPTRKKLLKSTALTLWGVTCATRTVQGRQPRVKHATWCHHTSSDLPPRASSGCRGTTAQQVVHGQGHCRVTPRHDTPISRRCSQLLPTFTER